MAWLRLHGVAVCLVLGLAAFPANGEDGGFLSGVEDLPLMPGLEEVAHAGMVFDKPGGRIVELYAVGAGDQSEVRRFYARTLPQLGWRQLDQGRYAREGETLTIEITSGSADFTVRFLITPQ